MAQNFSELANFLGAVADHLRRDYKSADHANVKDERIMGAMQGMLAKMVFPAFSQRGQGMGRSEIGARP